MLTFSRKIVGYSETPVTEEMIETIIVGSLEGGSNEWIGLDNSRPEWKDKPKDEPLSTWATFLILTGKTVHFYDIEDHSETFYLDLPKLLKGISLNAQRRPFDCSIDDGDVITCDSIMQYALFNEIVYG